MTEQQEQELYNFIRKAHGVILMGDDFLAIRSILSAPSEPAKTGGAEEVLHGILIDLYPGDIVYTHNPDALIQRSVVIKAMTTYAAKRCAEKDREIEDLSQRLTDALDRIAF